MYTLIISPVKPCSNMIYTKFIFTIGIAAIYHAYTFLYTIHISSFSLTPLSWDLTNVSSLGLLTLFFIIGIGYTLVVGLKLGMTSSGFWKQVVELRSRFFASPYHRMYMSGYIPFPLEVVCYSFLSSLDHAGGNSHISTKLES